MNVGRRLAAKAALQRQAPGADWPTDPLIQWVDTLLLSTADEVDSALDPQTIAHDVVDGTSLLVDVAGAFRAVGDCPTLAWRDVEGDVDSPADAVFAMFSDLGERIVLAELARLREQA